MGHYCFMNISEESQKGTGLAFETVGYMCEAFVFAYLGASTLSIESQYVAIIMGLITLFALPIVRGIMVYLLPLFYALARKEFPMNSQELKICWYSGMMRGIYLINRRCYCICFVSANRLRTLQIYNNSSLSYRPFNNFNRLQFHEKLCQKDWNQRRR